MAQGTVWPISTDPGLTETWLFLDAEVRDTVPVSALNCSSAHSHGERGPRPIPAEGTWKGWDLTAMCVTRARQDQGSGAQETSWGSPEAGIDVCCGISSVATPVPRECSVLGAESCCQSSWCRCIWLLEGQKAVGGEVCPVVGCTGAVREWSSCSDSGAREVMCPHLAGPGSAMSLPPALERR